MPTEDDLKRMFASADATGAPEFRSIDARQVIRRSRARRLPKQLAAGAGGALAIVGATVLGLQSVQFGTGAEDTALAPISQESEDSGGSGDAEDSAFSTKRAPASELNLCGGPLAEVAPSQFGLVLDVVFPAAVPAESERVDGLVIMTNSGAEHVTGSTFTVPAVTLSQDGVVVWHTNGATDAGATVVDLAPGESLQYAASFEPVRCTPEDDALEAFPTGLPPAGAGSYELSAAIDFSPDVPTATSELDLVTGTRSPITLE
jgi:hypothetical protein